MKKVCGLDLKFDRKLLTEILELEDLSAARSNN